LTQSTTTEASLRAAPPSGRTQQHVAVLGAGAIGTLLAEAAYEAGHRVTLCVRRAPDVLTVERDGRHRRLRLPAITTPSMVSAPVDWLLLAVRAHDTPRTLTWIRRLTGFSTRVVVLQNGVDHHERVGPLLAMGELLPALVYLSAERLGPGHVRHRWGRRIVVPAGEAGAALAELLAGTEVEVACEKDFTTAAWRKLLIGLAAGPLTALTLRRVGVLHHPDVRELARGMLTEAVTVGRAEGARLAADDVEQTLDFFTAMHPHGGTPMLRDRLAGRAVEHDLLPGAVVRAADRHGIPVPLNRTVLTLLRALDPGGTAGLQPVVPAGIG